MHDGSKSASLKLRLRFVALHHSPKKLGHFMFNKDRLIAHMLHSTEKKKDPAVHGLLSFWNVRLHWDEQWRSSYQAWCSLTPKVQPSVAACCCTPPHPLHTTTPHTYMSQYPYLHTTDMHTCLLTVTVISSERRANVEQWINTWLTPEPPYRQCIWGHN